MIAALVSLLLLMGCRLEIESSPNNCQCPKQEQIECESWEKLIKETYFDENCNLTCTIGECIDCQCPEIDEPICGREQEIDLETYYLNPKCDPCYKPVCVDLFSAYVQVTIEEKIQNDSRYCNHRKEDRDSSCICQEGYEKVMQLNPNCIPKICTFIKGLTLLGDVWESDAMLCVNALEFRDLTLCDYASDPYDKDICILAYVRLTKENSVCIKIEDEQLKNECLKEYKEMCVNQITSYTYAGDVGWANSEMCELALSKSDVEICNNIDNGRDNDVCKMIYARYSSNLSICNQIMDEHLKNECFK